MAKNFINKQFFLYAVLFSFLPFPIYGKVLPVPFVEQAPAKIWKQPWYDFCEEASLSMVDAYMQGKSVSSIKQKEEYLLYIDSIKRKFFGASLDESTVTLTTFINSFFPWEARVVENPSVQEIIQEIDAGNPVIVPVYGKLLKNPFFRSEGPRYHVIVIHGYDDVSKEFITHEPGTSRGENYRYSYNTILSANHDLVSFGSLLFGKKKMIFTSRELSSSLLTDGDRDGVAKVDELAYGTSLLYADTDRDGYSDGIEIFQGFSPLIDEAKLPSGSLVMTKNSPTVYQIFEGKKYPFASEQAFLSRKNSWKDIAIVSTVFLEKFSLGDSIK